MILLCCKLELHNLFIIVRYNIILERHNQIKYNSNNSMLYFSLILVLALLIAIYILLRMLLKKSIHLYLSVLEKSSSRS